jgi:hypothetical protein
MTDRICWHGHRVTDTEATSCPLCGVTMDNARIAAAAAEKAEAERQPRGPDRSWSWIVAGLMLGLIGSIITSSSDEDAGTVVGLIMCALGGFALLVAAVGIGVYNGMLDFTDRERFNQRRSPRQP